MPPKLIKKRATGKKSQNNRAKATVITVMNMKGGVGKTTLCAHLAGMLALYEFRGKHRRVLAIDYDPQFNLSQMYLRPKTYFELESKGKTSLAILKDDETEVDPFAIQVPGNLTPPSPTQVTHPIYRDGGTLDLIPSTLDLMYIALGQTDKRTGAFEERFAKFIKRCRARYDVILIDCHPAGSILTKTSLANSNHVLIPILSSRFARRGIDLMRRFIENAKKGPHKTPYHIIFNDNGTATSTKRADAIRTHERYAKHCMVQRLRNYKAFSDPVSGRRFVWYSKVSYSTKAWTNLNQVTSEVVERLDL